MSYIAFQIKQNQIKIISNPLAISIIRTLAHTLLSKSNKIKEKQTAIHPQFRPSTKPNISENIIYAISSISASEVNKT